jgi:hypothetical protein
MISYLAECIKFLCKLCCFSRGWGLFHSHRVPCKLRMHIKYFYLDSYEFSELISEATAKLKYLSEILKNQKRSERKKCIFKQFLKIQILYSLKFG